MANARISRWVRLSKFFMADSVIGGDDPWQVQVKFLRFARDGYLGWNRITSEQRELNLRLIGIS